VSFTDTDHHHSLRSADELHHYLQQHGLSWQDAHLPDQGLFSDQFPIRVPYYYADLINWQDPNDPLRLMVIPDPREQQPHTYEVGDPIGDTVKEVVPGLIHRYVDRCLLLLTSYCLVHCRFCFRREVVGKVRPVQFQKIQSYLQNHPEVQEVIFSGGDPFTFPIGFMHSLIEHLANLHHIRVWRFHTRVPATDPLAVTDEWIAQLKLLKEKYQKQVVVVIHVNHPRELTLELKALVTKLHHAGCMVLSQSVLLKGVNTDSETLKQLFRGLVLLGIKPYYLHHLDPVYGSHHFRISIEEGKKLFSSLRGHLSSLCIPEYVIDSPGGYGKIPVMWLEQVQPKTYQATNFEGQLVTYVDHADD
jgi:lysine 2,3-aminomutase